MGIHLIHPNPESGRGVSGGFRMRAVLILAAMVLAAGTGCEQARSSAKTAAGPQPGVTVTADSQPVKAAAAVAPKQEALLLLDDGPESQASDPGAADNSRCQVCHINFLKEELTVVHAKAGIGCAQCHGVSDAHIADESWASGGNGTAPDIMYPRQKINPFCVECHTRQKIGQVEMHNDQFDASSSDKTCVDCHGRHLMAKRKTKWK